MSMDVLPKLLLFGCCVALQQFAIKAAEEGEWDYGKNGPLTDAWCKKSEVCCSGSSQSPINLDLKLAKLGVTQAFEFIAYTADIFLIGINNGHTVQFSQDPDTINRFTPRPGLRGGGLNGTYVLHSFHFHWGSDDSKGAEHFDQGFQYPMELHLVHYRSDFKGLTEAVSSGQAGAIAVLGIMFATGEMQNNAIEDLTQSLRVIINPQKSVALQRSVKLIDFLPFNKVSIYRYMGSLTTPGCSEVVAWTVFTTPTYLASYQLNRFRKVKGEDYTRLVNNFRPLQDLGSRELLRLEAKGQGVKGNPIYFDDGKEDDSHEVIWP